MKKQNFLPGLILALFLASIMVSATLNPAKKSSNEVPDDVQAVIKGKCFGCHNTESRNDKAKEKLLFDKLDSLSIIDKISTYKGIEKELNDNKMPPEKFLERFPDRALTADEKQLLLDWAGNERKNVNVN